MEFYKTWYQHHDIRDIFKFPNMRGTGDDEKTKTILRFIAVVFNDLILGSSWKWWSNSNMEVVWFLV